MAHVFISYSRADSHFARLLKLELEKAEFELWLDTEQLLAGEDWRQGIDEAINDSFALLVVMSPESCESKYVTYEWAYALGIGVKVIPLVVKSMNSHPRLDVLQHFNFTNPDPGLQPWARLIDRLNEICDEQGSKIIRVPHDVPYEIRRALNALNSWNPQERKVAVSVLGVLKNPSVMPALLQALSDTEGDVRSHAAQALGKIGDASAVPALLQALSDTEGDVRSHAAQALGKIGDASAVPALLQALSDTEGDVRSHAAQALGKIGDATAVSALLQALSDTEGDVRNRAAWAIGEIGDVNAVPILLRAFRDTNWTVRNAITEALGKIGDTSAVPALLRALNDSASEVRAKAAESLQNIGTPESLAAFEEWQRKQS